MADELLEPSVPNIPVLHQAQTGQQDAIAQKIQRLRQMEEFFKSLPDRRTEAGLGPVTNNIREMAYED